MNSHVSIDPDTLLPWRDPDFRASPYRWYDILRKEAPVYRDPKNPNTYIVSRHDDVAEFGKHPSLTVKPPEWVRPSSWSRFKDNIVVKDPPEHTALRRRSNKFFTPKLAKGWAEATAEAVNAALDDLGPSGMIEAYRNLALIPGHHAMCQALGLPNDGYDTAASYMHDAMVALGSEITPEEEERSYAAFAYLADRVSHHVELRKRSPNDGAVSNWIDLVASGEMTERQLQETVLTFWITGTPNAAFMITGGLECFARQPELFETWRNSPERREALLAEIARLHPAEVSFIRFTTEPLKIRGVTIPPGMMIRFMVASANRDPDAFPNPHEIDLERDANAHLSFGTGPHACAGINLSKAEAHAVYDVLSARVKRIELGGDPVYDHDDRTFAYKRLPLRLVV
jgi:cytochrome P450